MIDIVYYIGHPKPINTPPVYSPSRQSIPMQFISHMYNSGGNECKDPRVMFYNYQICLPSDWKSAF